MNDFTALNRLQLMPAHQLAVGMQVLCAISDPDDPEASLVAEFDHHLESEMVVIDAYVIAEPLSWGYRTEDVAVQLMATISHVLHDADSTRVVLGGGTSMYHAVYATPNTQVRVLMPCTD